MAPGNLERLLDAETRARLALTADIDFDEVLHDFSTPEAHRALRRAEVLLTCWGCPPVTAEVLAHAPELRLIAHGAGSVKSIVTDACWERGIRVTSAAAANAIPVAEYTVAVIVLAGKRTFAIQDAFRRDAVQRDWENEFPSLGNFGITVGVVGASHVGRRVLELLRSYDVRVLLSDPTIGPADAEELGAALVDLDTLVERSDVVSLHAPDIPATRNLIDARRLARMKDGATLINTARGRLVDTEALTAELETGRIHAVLDVTHPEPLPAGHRLLGLPNVVVTPHIAGSLGNEVRRMGALVVAEVERFARGEPLAHEVLRERLAVLA